jgi:hypothetical protein
MGTIMSIHCEVFLRWDATPAQQRALGVALWGWCHHTARIADPYQYLDNQALADLLAGRLPTSGSVSQGVGLPYVHFLVRGDPACDRQTTLESLRLDIPSEGITDVRVEGISWGLTAVQGRPKSAG